MLKSSYTSREADDIANLVFIGGKTNRNISDKPPVVYFPSLLEKIGAPAFDAQCIPTEAALLEVVAYKAFLTKRRELMGLRLNAFPGTWPSAGY